MDALTNKILLHFWHVCLTVTYSVALKWCKRGDSIPKTSKNSFDDY